MRAFFIPLPQLTWSQAQRNSYLKIRDNSFQLLAEGPATTLITETYA